MNPKSPLAPLLAEPARILELEPEDLALPLLRDVAESEQRGDAPPHLGNFMNGVGIHLGSHPSKVVEAVQRALTEAWVWLERELLLAPRPDQHSRFMFVTRRGHAFLESGDVASLHAMGLLPKGVLDPALSAKVRAAYIRGEYDVAVFHAFKHVEVRVRELSGLGDDLLGTKLMRKAFDVDAGPLTDMGQNAAERQALSDLFSGAIGLFKNPGSHRDVPLNDPIDAVELLLFADQLVKIAARHAQRRVTPAAG
jgi:uncharacterized protein (TIGR02391 family)